MSKSRQLHQQGHHSSCPDRKLLSAMLRGELPPKVTDELAIHIDRCPACIQTLELIDDTSDSLAQDLRNASPTDFSIVHQELLEQESYGSTTMFGLMGTTKGMQARLNPPCDFGQYYVEKHAGRGGMGDVYLGFQKTLKRPTAIKLLRPNRTNSETAAERFKEEMRVVAMLDHPNLVKAYDGGEYEGRLYLAMELLDGETLADYVKRKGPFSPQRACQICTKAARGLQHAHEAGIYHRDIKPGNIMFTKDGKIKVLDLGLAFAPQDVISDGRNESISFAGTPDYMAPEQARDPKSVDARTDIYSLGCTLYFLLSGVPPFPKSRFPSVASLMKAHQTEPVPDIRLLNGDVSDELTEILNRMLCKDPIGRPQSAIEVCKLIRPFCEAVSTDATIADETPDTEIRIRRLWPWISLGGLATLFGLLTLYELATIFQLGLPGSSPSGRDVIENSIGMELKLIPAGEFIMGSPESLSFETADERPEHSVRITQAFYIGVTEVTQGQWSAVMGTRPWGGIPNVKEGKNYPAISVSWDAAIEYCAKLSEIDGQTYRLPTEAEWEYACRSGSSTAYSFGANSDQLRNYDWYFGNIEFGAPAPPREVGMKLENQFGLNDMQGNVREWCLDWHNRYDSEATVDPHGPSSGNLRIVRGGSWICAADSCRCAYRSEYDPSYRCFDIGFRVVRLPPAHATAP